MGPKVGSGMDDWLTGLCPFSAQGSREPGDMLPRKLKQVLRQEFWAAFENLLMQGTEVGPMEVEPTEVLVSPLVSPVLLLT